MSYSHFAFGANTTSYHRNSPHVSDFHNTSVDSSKSGDIFAFEAVKDETCDNEGQI
jgi:hypothetical protein